MVKKNRGKKEGKEEEKRGLGQAVLLKRWNAFSLPLTSSFRNRATSERRFVLRLADRRMHFAGYYVHTKVARVSLHRFLGKIVIVAPAPRYDPSVSRCVFIPPNRPPPSSSSSSTTDRR